MSYRINEIRPDKRKQAMSGQPAKPGSEALRDALQYRKMHMKKAQTAKKY